MWLLSYNDETGEFTWKVRPSQGVKVGDKAGRINTSGHVQITYQGTSYLAHRVAWVVANGDIPKGMQIDHINGDRLDNRISNLRLVTIKGNAENKKRYKNNSSGFKGVSWDKKSKKWRAYIGHNGDFINLGFFDDAITAGACAAGARALLFECSTDRI